LPHEKHTSDIYHDYITYTLASTNKPLNIPAEAQLVDIILYNNLYMQTWRLPNIIEITGCMFLKGKHSVLSKLEKLFIDCNIFYFCITKWELLYPGTVKLYFDTKNTKDYVKNILEKHIKRKYPNSCIKIK